MTSRAPALPRRRLATAVVAGMLVDGGLDHGRAIGP